MNMKILNTALAMLLTLAAATSCSDSEDTLEPTGISSAYHLPQGNHDYDQRIVDFFNQTGTYILYDFTPKEACWSPNKLKLGWPGDEDTGEEGYAPVKADDKYVGKALDLLDEVFLKYYSDKCKKELMPIKILLCSQLDSVYQDYEYIRDPNLHVVVSYKSSPVPAWYNYHSLCVNYVNDKLDALTAKEKNYLKYYLNIEFMKSIMVEGLVAPTKEFEAVVDYSKLPSIPYANKRFEAGSFPEMMYFTSFDGSMNASAKRDWYEFMYIMITYPESFLTDDNVTSDYRYYSVDAMFHGVLSPVKDTKGLLRLRYNMVRDYFKTNYGTDLQAIGNAVI